MGGRLICNEVNFTNLCDPLSLAGSSFPTPTHPGGFAAGVTRTLGLIQPSCITSTQVAKTDL